MNIETIAAKTKKMTAQIAESGFAQRVTEMVEEVQQRLDQMVDGGAATDKIDKPISSGVSSGNSVQAVMIAHKASPAGDAAALYGSYQRVGDARGGYPYLEISAGEAPDAVVVIGKQTAGGAPYATQVYSAINQGPQATKPGIDADLVHHKSIIETTYSDGKLIETTETERRFTLEIGKPGLSDPQTYGSKRVIALVDGELTITPYTRPTGSSEYVAMLATSYEKTA